MSDSVKDQLEAMIAGTHEDVEVEETEAEEVEEDNYEESVDDEVEEETTDEVDEDTDQDEETEEEEDTDEEIDESAEETSENDEDTEEEDAHATTDEESDKTDEVEESEDNQEEEVDTSDTTDEIDYKKFYEEVALAKFTANGRQVEGFKNPEDLIRAQQMLHGYSDKMKVFKEYKKFLKPLEERKITADPDKFNLAMSLLDGDIEAIKTVIKEKGIDPLEMDLEDIKYTPKNTLPSEAQMLIEEVSNQAKDLGVEDKFYQVLTKDFDQESLEEFIEKGAVRRDLLQHLQDGTYDIVQDEIKRMELLDSAGELEGMSSVNKYRTAIQRLSARMAEESAKEEPKAQKPVAKPEPKVEPKVDPKVTEEFKKKAEEKEKKVAEERKKAASVTKKRVVKQKTESVKPEALKGDEFRDYFRDMMMR